MESVSPAQFDVLSSSDKTSMLTRKRNIRNLVGFWILGLCNNYAYVIMLSAAFDLLKDNRHKNKVSDLTAGNGTTNHTEETFCNSISTGAILLADILPSLTIKLVAPFLALGFHTRVIIAVILSAASFILTSLSIAHWMTFLGVICAAVSSGLGEVTFLSLSTYFDKDVVSTWSSGTGGAGVAGALSYASLTHALSVEATLQVMLVMPVFMAITFWIIIDHTPATKLKYNLSPCVSELDPMLTSDTDTQNSPRHHQYFTCTEKLLLIKPLLKYMIPLGLVYFAEYFINQGLMELLYFPSARNWLDHKEQYRWYQVVYQIGVLLSRSSVNLFQVKKLWILAVLQFVNLIFILFEAYYYFLPNIWIVIIIILYEGLLGGCAYVNTFYRINQEVKENHREFSMGIASLADSTGIALAGAISLPVHAALCRMH